MPPRRQRATVVAITSGKGGVGKSNVAVNLAITLAGAGKRVTLMDADLGLANADVLC
ncbi:MAG: P-loop NTPase, partial [Planctomycetota bacterium]|nr:P-loop NTPase [Planctomycetota bacterium]